MYQKYWWRTRHGD